LNIYSYPFEEIPIRVKKKKKKKKKATKSPKISAGVNHTHQEGNRAAHVLVQYAKHVNHCIVWLEETPHVIDPQVSLDFPTPST
jgi:hypothetical protein